VAAVTSVTGLAAELTTDPAALVTAVTAPVTGALTAEVSVAADGLGLAGAEAEDATAGSAPGWSSVAAWA